MNLAFKANEKCVLNDSNMTENKNEKSGNGFGMWVAYGIVFGGGIGIFFGNIALGAGVGLVIGAVGSLIFGAFKE